MAKLQVTAYNVVTKKKNVPMENPVIDKDGNRYSAKGKDSKGNKMFAFISESDAKAYIKAGVAKKGKGW